MTDTKPDTAPAANEANASAFPRNVRFVFECTDFECTNLHAHDSHTRVHLDAAGTPGGALTLRVPQGIPLPTLGAFYELVLFADEPPPAPQKTGSVDVSSDLLAAGGKPGTPSIGADEPPPAPSDAIVAPASATAAPATTPAKVSAAAPKSA